MNAMRAGEPDIDALRDLFTELEFTSLLKELLPSMQLGKVDYREARGAEDVEAVLKAIPAEGTLAVAIEASAPVAVPDDEEEDDEPEEALLPLTGDKTAVPRSVASHSLAISSTPNAARPHRYRRPGFSKI